MRVFTVLALVVVIFGIFSSSASRSEDTSQTYNIKEASLKEGTDVENDEEIDDTSENKDAVSKSDENDEEEEENDNIESDSLAESDNTVENIKATSDEEDTPGLFPRRRPRKSASLYPGSRPRKGRRQRRSKTRRPKPCRSCKRVEDDGKKNEENLQVGVDEKTAP